jgi:NADH-quinone oxidoreductase subunit G
VNEAWACDRGRFGFHGSRSEDRLTSPLVRREGELVPVSWTEAIEAAAAGLGSAGNSVGVLSSGRLTLETSYAYSRFARCVLGTNSFDFRVRGSSKEEAQFLGAFVAGQESPVTYGDLESAKKVVLVGFEPEDESPMIFLRLRKAVRRNNLRVETLASLYSRGSQKLGAHFIPVTPGEYPAAIRSLDLGEGAIVLAGESLAQVPGALSALGEMVTKFGVRLAWVPRRCGEIAALEAGCLPGLLPRGRSAANPEAHAEISASWKAEIPTTPGLDVHEQIEAAEQGNLRALVLAGIEVADYPNPRALMKAVKKAFVVCLETRLSEVALMADVVFPVAPIEETSGTFLNWEFRPGDVRPTLKPTSASLHEIRVLSALSDALGTALGFRTVDGAMDSFDALPPANTPRPPAPTVKPAKKTTAAKGQAVVSTWRELLDDSRCLDGATRLRATARRCVARISSATAEKANLIGSEVVKVTGPQGSLTFPLIVTDQIAEGTVWLPTRSSLGALNSIGVFLGSVVDLEPAKGGRS